jgi:hypothetical protein
MSKNRGNEYRYQILRSEARKAAQALAHSNENLKARGIDTTQIRFDSITPVEIEASDLWGDEATLYPWYDVHPIPPLPILLPLQAFKSGRS